jgi:ankyrin repeat protein
MIEKNEIQTSFSTTQNELKEYILIINKIKKLALSYKKTEYEDVKKEIYQILKNSKFNIENIKNDLNETLLHILGKEGKLEPVKLIIENYIEILGINETFFNWFCLENNDNLSILEIICEKDNKKLINYIYEIISKTTEEKFRLKEKRNNIFHLAAKANNSYAIIFFYEKLQNYFKEELIIDLPNKYDATPLHYACYYGSKDVIDLLLDLGANIKAVDSEGNSVLHYAVQSKSERVVKKLLVRGAKKNIRNYKGKIPYDIAMELNLSDIALILKNFTLMEKFFSKNEEIKPIKGGRNNLLLLLTVIFILLFKFCYLVRIMGYMIKKNQLFFYPLMSELVTSKFRYNIYNDSGMNYTYFFDVIYYHNLSTQFSTNINDCFEDNRIMKKVAHILLGYLNFITLAIDLFLLFLIIRFICFSKNIFEKKKIKQKEPLSKLFDRGNYVCIKCRIPILKGTVHCIVCNACCKDFDHHCFWLNRCISKKNLKSFKLFLILITLFCIGNIYFSIINIYAYVITHYSGNEFFYEKITKNTEGFLEVHKYFNLFHKFTFFLLFTTLGVGSLYSLIFQIIPVIKYRIFIKNKTSLLGDFESSLLETTQVNSIIDSSRISNI